MPSESRYLLIVSCSQSKRSDPGLLPAIERYDGVFFRVLAKAKREGYWPENLKVLILSAKYGLLDPKYRIENYDLRMTEERAIELRSSVKRTLSEQVLVSRYTEIFLNLGRVYLLALQGWEDALREETSVIYASGGIGQKAAQMRQWLLELSGVEI